MELTRIIEAVAADLRRAGGVGGEETARVAELLVAAIEPTVRLHFLEALHEVAHELEASTPGVSVEIRLEGREPVLRLVTTAPSAETDAPLDADSWTVFANDELLRTTIRLPEGLKARMEQDAAGAGASFNSYVVSALARFLEGSLGATVAGRGPQPGRRMPRRMTGFVQS